MKKYYLLFVTLLYASIGLSTRSAELPEGGGEKNFSLKNSDKSKGPIYFMAVNNEGFTEGLLRPGDLANYFFNADDFFNILGPTRLYIWEDGNILKYMDPRVLENLRKTVVGSQVLAINQIDFPYTPNWFFTFSPGKVIHVKWKKGKLLPRKGKAKKRGRLTQEGFELINNVTKNYIDANTWVFREEEGRWLGMDTMLKEALSGTGIDN